ncbi:MAG TPA: beta-ketoacyl-ACP synthase III [Candidatus Polarisedimenticolia bacterium]|jgi:3-oxoacyl-[acyl-carrier-protein] synthase-3|nr:beta-ketoacyl-ACP synthase III [Candidatus Polarisedimenticolia bacterium]
MTSPGPSPRQALDTPRLRAVVTGTGSCLPERVLTNQELEKMVDTSDDWITSRTGIKERRIAAEGEYLSQYATEAGKRALEMSGVPAEEIDLIVCATVTPDRPIPSTACTIQQNLGSRKAAAFDLAAGCSGYIYALAVADRFLACGPYRNALVIGGELLSKYVDWKDRTTCIIFADGAGATVLSAREGIAGILATSLRSDGSMADFIHIPAGGTMLPTSEKTVQERQHFIRMKGNETFKIAVRSIEEVSREVITASGLSASDIDLYIPHQANRRIIEAVGTRLGLRSDQLFMNIDRVGNTSSASIPIALDEAVRAGKVDPGDILLFAAFGAGLTWGAALLRW